MANHRDSCWVGFQTFFVSPFSSKPQMLPTFRYCVTEMRPDAGLLVLVAGREDARVEMLLTAVAKKT
jgi:hypothetical protein